MAAMAHVYGERRDLPDDLRRMLDAGTAAVEYTPPLDLIETETAIQVLLDLPGVAASQIDIVFSRNVLLIAGEKTPAAPEHSDAAFHIAERAFGRFARAIGLEGAFDAGKAVATLHAGELRVVLPKLKERRGGRIRIPIT
jgi:HSP20 family protein